MPTISDILRTEKKYPLDYLDARKLCGKLNRVLQPDPHCAGTDGYLVRSLYFDSYDNEDYFDKAAGLENRKKNTPPHLFAGRCLCEIRVEAKAGGRSKKAEHDGIERSCAEDGPGKLFLPFGIR